MSTCFYLLHGLLITYLTSGSVKTFKIKDIYRIYKDYANEGNLVQFLLEKKYIKTVFPFNICCRNQTLNE